MTAAHNRTALRIALERLQFAPADVQSVIESCAQHADCRRYWMAQVDFYDHEQAASELSRTWSLT